MHLQKKDYLKTLYQELPKLEENGIISRQTTTKIKTHYGPLQETETKSKNLSSIIFGILGTLLITSGIILMLAHNWDALSRPIRAIIAVTPLVFSIGANLFLLLKKDTLTTVWKENLSLFWMASIGIAIALISQTYHIPGHFEQFLVVWMLLSLPILYIHRSLAALIGYVLGATVWVIYTQEFYITENPYMYILLILGAIPLITGVLKDKFQSAAPYILTWSILPLLSLGLSFTFAYSPKDIWIPLFGVVCSVVYLLNQFYPKRNELLKNPLPILGGVSIWIMALTLGFKPIWTYTFIKRFHAKTHFSLTEFSYAHFDYGMLILLSAILLFLLYKTVKKSDKKENALLGSFGVLCLISYGLAKLSPTPMILTVIYTLFNLFVFLIGLFRVSTGIAKLDYLKVNTGITMMASIFILRFFDSNLPFSTRGIVFIAIGLGFWFANSRIAKRKRVNNV